MIIAIAVVILGLGVAVAVVGGQAAGEDLGQDFRFYREVGQRWLNGGPYYLGDQLAGPYEFRLMVDNPYPPTALVLFVPAAVLPPPLAATLWWSLPIATIAWQLAVVRPAPWSWPILAACAAWPRTGGAVIFGNTDLWIAAAISAGTLWGWPAILAVIKPTFAPFALVGARDRQWWIAIAAIALTIVLQLPEWLRYPMALVNAENLSLDYSFGSLPIVLLPIVAFLARQRSAEGSGAANAGSPPPPSGVARPRP